MKRPEIICALAVVVGWASGACSSDEKPSNGEDGSGGAAALGGSSGAAPGGGTSGETGGASSGGATGTGGTSGASSGTSGTGSGVGGQSGSSSGVGGVTGGAVIDGGVGGGGAGLGGAGMGGAGSGGVAGYSMAGNDAGSGGGTSLMMNFFVTSTTSATGNLGGLAMADMRCQMLAANVGHGSKTWRAYLSVANPMTHAINRIGEGPYYNSTGRLVAMDKAALHARNGDAELFIDERGNRVNGQWSGSPTPNQHDVLTGSTRAGMLSTGNTCGDWMSTDGNAQVGHTDGLGPGMATTGNYPYWNGSHTAPCDDLALTGGAGKLYCFVGS